MSPTVSRPREEVLADLQNTRTRLEALEQELASLAPPLDSFPSPQPPPGASVTQQRHPLSLREYRRYGRQMILPSVGLEGASEAARE